MRNNTMVVKTTFVFLCCMHEYYTCVCVFVAHKLCKLLLLLLALSDLSITLPVLQRLLILLLLIPLLLLLSPYPYPPSLPRHSSRRGSCTALLWTTSAPLYTTKSHTMQWYLLNNIITSIYYIIYTMYQRVMPIACIVLLPNYKGDTVCYNINTRTASPGQTASNLCHDH